METGKMKRSIRLFLILLLLPFNLISWAWVESLSKPPSLEIDFLDVGQGDSIFIQTPDDMQVIIDGGPSSGIIEKLGSAMPFYDRSIDLLILTHPDPDHLLGLIDVLKNYTVGELIYTGIKSDNPEFKEFEKEISRNKTSLQVVKKGNKVLIGDYIYFDILAPLEDFEGREVSDFNTSSIVFRLVFDNFSAIFTGDAPTSIESKLIAEKGNSLDSDILKVGHHGSKTSTSEEFLERVTPELAVIQVGSNHKNDSECDDKENNRYGHPNCAVMERLRKYGIKVLRTDLNGDVKIRSDGKNFEIINF